MDSTDNNFPLDPGDDLPLRLSKHQPTTKVISRTTLIQTITLYKVVFDYATTLRTVVNT